MNVRFRASFAKDLREVKDKEVLKRVKGIIEQVEQARSLQEIAHLKKLKGGGHYYRIRAGEYRIGLELEGGGVTFVRCLNRKEIYRYFP